MPEAKNRLTITGLDEISFVPEGDNPPALIKLCKAKANTSTEGAHVAEPSTEDTYVSKEAFDQLQKQFAEMQERNAVEKINGECTEIVRKICGPVKDVDLPSMLREIDRKCAPEVAQQVRKVLTILGERIQKGGIAKIGTIVPGGLNAAEQFDQVVTGIAKANPGLSRNDALIRAASERPDLYEATKRGE
jgi:hypothetical protein